MLLRSKGTLFPKRSAWSLSLASLAPGRVVESQSGETHEPPFSAALGLAALLGLAFSGARASWAVVVEGEPRTPLLRCARPGRCARLCLLRRACKLDWRSRGRPPNSPSSLRSAWPPRLAFFCAWACCGCVVFWGDPRAPPFSAALGLAVTLGLAFFGVRAS